uniref:Uncharacterized protein n=1 Tax=Fagus sylvatica TaxID=28930 RepID=A0A2N9I4D4_FAGSY
MPRSQETLVEPTVLFVARPASASSSIDHPDLIPTGEVSEMASPINLYQLIGKKSKEASNSKSKGKAKEVHHTVLDTSDVELFAKVAHSLSQVACLPGDIRAWDAMFSGQIFFLISRGLMMARKEGKQEVMGEVKAQLQGVFNGGFRDGWKLALRRADAPDFSDLYLRSSTPLPYPEAGLKDSDDEDEEDEEDEAQEAKGEQDNSVVDPTLLVTSNPHSFHWENE